jgi:hypothetical protein
MDTDELFSFLEEQNSQYNTPESSSSWVEVEPPVTQPKKKRRKVVSNIAPAGNGEEASRTQKKARVETIAPQPIVLDEFETVQKREVTASAGLTGQVDDSQRLELRHQVCYSLNYSYSSSRKR